MPPGNSLSFLDHGGAMGERMRTFDWPHHPLGDPDSWPQALRTVVGLILTTHHPAMIFWGERLYCLYNDAFAPGPKRSRRSARIR